MKKNKHIQNGWMRFKVSTLTASVTSVILAGLPLQIQASDIDIYQAGGTGATRIYLMLDTSGSMDNSDSFEVDYGYLYTVNERQCNRIYCWDVQVEKDLCTRQKIPSNLSVSIPNKENTASTSYIYATSADNYCAVDLGSTVLTNTVKDNAYKTKIASVCDRVGMTNVYNCYSRMVNLRKGLISVVADASIDDKIYFALGNYPYGQTGQTLSSFQSMNTTGKASLIKTIQGLIANSGTPISPAYNVAGDAIIRAGNSVTGASESCTGNGVYFLTDGEPTTDWGNGNFSFTLANNNIPALSSSNLRTLSLGSNASYWTKIGDFSQNIRNSKFLIKTATVGFGGGYYLTQNQKDSANITINNKKYFDCSYIDQSIVKDTDHRSLCQWGAKTIPSRTDVGGFGEGGFYTAQSSADLVGSIKSFINDTTVPIDGSTIGSSTIPIDALNTNQLQPFAYFPMFKPLIETEDQLWAGNLKKYNVIDGSIYDINKTAVFKNSTDFNTSLKDYWYNSAATVADSNLSYGGNLSQLMGAKLPKIENTNLVLPRNLFMNDSSAAGALMSATDVLSAGTLADREYLYGLLGYSKLTTADLTALKSKSYTDQLEYLKTKTSAQGYQLGAIIHSSPILLTQKGAIVESNNELSSEDRDDYVLFGTTQGVLHVVKSGTQNSQVTNGTGVATGSGEEVFTFIPKEMLTKQKNGFIESLAQDKKNSGFYYGVDGPWTAHTVYEPNFYDTQVGDVSVSRDGLQVKENSTLSHQYVYGGLRMGGRSYYALNLSNITKPKLMFHINPDAKTTGALSYMGQSWSKPSVGYVKWDGKRKLVMIVGGGYDEKYEDPTFANTVSGSVKGNGVYIFDAENGNLLWWGSSNATDGAGTAKGDASTKITDMVSSIPSRIKTVDRDSDGLIDHLYVGDLGGKVFRLDINPKHEAGNSTEKFMLNAVTLAEVKEAGKNPPRFYEAPTFTIHTDDKSKKFAVVSMASGDRSSPLKSESTVAQDMIFGFYDRSVIDDTPTVPSKILLTSMSEVYGANKQDKTVSWYYKLPKVTTMTKSYQTRGLSEGVALDSDLYYSVFNPSITNNGSSGTSTSCSGGIVGASKAYKLCLPYGACGSDTKITEIGDLGAGIISLNVGPGSTKNSRTLIFNDPKKVYKDPNTGKLIEYTTTNKLLPKHWYEMTPYVGAK